MQFLMVFILPNSTLIRTDLLDLAKNVRTCSKISQFNRWLCLHFLVGQLTKMAKKGKPKHRFPNLPISNLKNINRHYTHPCFSTLNTAFELWSPGFPLCVCQNIFQVKGLRVAAGVSICLWAGVECGVCDGGHPVAMWTGRCGFVVKGWTPELFIR